MPRLSFEARRRVAVLYSRGYSVASISARLQQEGVDVSKRALYNLLEKIRLTGTIKDLPRRKRSRILTKDMMIYIEEQLRQNDEFTASRIKTALIQKWPDLKVSISTIKRVRQEMGWVCTRPHYCQLLREVCLIHVLLVMNIQWNLSVMDTLGPGIL